MYSHVSALLLAWALEADVMLPPAVTRDSFDKRYNRGENVTDMKWIPLRFNELWDMQRVVAAWARRGSTLYSVSYCRYFHASLTLTSTIF